MTSNASDIFPFTVSDGTATNDVPTFTDRDLTDFGPAATAKVAATGTTFGLGDCEKALDQDPP